MNKVDFLCNSRLLGVRRACALCSTASACKVDENDDKFRSFLGQSAPAEEKARVENVTVILNRLRGLSLTPEAALVCGAHLF